MKFEDLKTIETIDQLNKLETVEKIAEIINAEICPLKINPTSYEDILDVINKLKVNWIKLSEIKVFDEMTKYVFYLTELEGEQRNKKIGIVEDMYSDEKKAKAWYRRLSKIVHPDKNNGEGDVAFKILSEIYNVLIDKAGDFKDE
jgi:hypothetical protein